MFSDVRLTYRGQFSRGFWAANHPSSDSQSECHNKYSLQKAPKVVAMSGPQSKCSNRAKDWRTANKQQQQKLHKTEICLGYASPYSLRSRGQLARFQHHAVILTDALSMIQKVEWEAQIGMCQCSTVCDPPSKIHADVLDMLVKQQSQVASIVEGIKC